MGGWWGENSIIIIIVMTFFSPVASPPLNVVVNIVSTTWFFVTWSPPAMVGDGITGYYVRVNGIRYPTSTTTYNASDLISGRLYSFDVSGINSFGEGNRYSSSVQLMTAVTGELPLLGPRGTFFSKGKETKGKGEGEVVRGWGRWEVVRGWGRWEGGGERNSI